MSRCNSSPATPFEYFLCAIARSENNRRFDLFLSLAILCKISNAQSEVKLAAVTDRAYLKLVGYHRLIVGHLEKDAQRTVGDEMNAFTHHP